MVAPQLPASQKLRRLLTIVLIVIAGCALLWVAFIPRGRTRGLSDSHEMKRAILKHVPLGTSIEDAKAFMQREGFHCDQEFKNHTISWDGPAREGLEFVYCERSESARIIEVRIWGVALVVTDGKVTEILVRTGVFGV